MKPSRIEWDVSEIPRMFFWDGETYRPCWGLDPKGERRRRRFPYCTVQQTANHTGLPVAYLRRLWWRVMMRTDLINPSAVQFMREGDRLKPTLSVVNDDGQLARRPADGVDFLSLEQTEAETGISARRLKRAWLGVWGYALQEHFLNGVTNGTG
jgi:hypothetical protein